MRRVLLAVLAVVVQQAQMLLLLDMFPSQSYPPVLDMSIGNKKPID
jgi:hypothetical protein